MEELKRCYKCGETKSQKEFWKDKHKRDGLSARCIGCDKKRNDLYRSTHKEYFKEWKKAHYDPKENPFRYAKHREAYLRRRNEYSKSARGRFMGLLSSAKRRAKDKNLEFDLDIDWLLNLYENQNRVCLLTGITLAFESHRGGKRILQPFSPSLDRIDTNKGYTKENTRLVCTFINLALNHFGEDIFAQGAKGFLAVQEQRQGRELVSTSTQVTDSSVVA